MRSKKISEGVFVVRGRGTRTVAAALVVLGAVLSVWTQSAFGCVGGEVTDANLWIGETQSSAEGHNTSTVYRAKGKKFGWHMHWEADTPDDDDFTIVIRDTTDGIDLGTFSAGPTVRHDANVVTLSSSASTGSHTIVGKVKRNGTSTWKEQSRTLVVVEVKLDMSGLADADEENPGKYINVNWNDDDGDGWNPNNTPPGGSYTGDKADANIVGGDNDFQSFTLSIEPSDVNGNVSLTFASNVKVWKTNTKREPNGVSSQVSSGTTFSVASLPKTLYLEGYSGSSSFRDVNLMAQHSVTDANDKIKVTVFEVDVNGLFSYGNQQSDNDKKHSTFGGSSDKNGKISWDDGNGDGTTGDNDSNCRFFHNCVEFQGTVKPAGVTTQVYFDFKRDKGGETWKKLVGGSWTPDITWVPWTNDDLSDNDEDLTPSGSDHIYSIDGPGYIVQTRTATYDYLAYICDFREYVKVKIDGTWYQCSDFYKWHTKCYTKPKDAIYMTRDWSQPQLSGSGWVTVPSSP